MLCLLCMGPCVLPEAAVLRVLVSLVCFLWLLCLVCLVCLVCLERLVGLAHGVPGVFDGPGACCAGCAWRAWCLLWLVCLLGMWHVSVSIHIKIL